MTETLTTTPPADDLVVPFPAAVAAHWPMRSCSPVAATSSSAGHHARVRERFRDIAVDIIDTDGEQRVSLYEADGAIVAPAMTASPDDAAASSAPPRADGGAAAPSSRGPRSTRTGGHPPAAAPARPHETVRLT